MSISQTTIILGHTLLIEHNLEINWCRGDIHMTRCLAACRPVVETNGLSNSAWLKKLAENTNDTWEFSLTIEYILKRFQKYNQKPLRPSCHQALHSQTLKKWAKTNF